MENNTQTANETAPRRFSLTRLTEHVVVELYATVDGKEYRAYGYSVGMAKPLADRLGNAWVAKAIGRELYIAPRVASVGGFFIQSKTIDMPLGRKLNADLKRVGF
jgi:hypothetical protein